MNLVSFLSILNDKTGGRKLPPVFCFVGKKYPALLLYHINQLYKKNSYAIKYLDAEISAHEALYKSHLEMSFLGTTSLYQLSDFSHIESKQQQLLQNYLEAYEGPHTVYFFSDKPLQSKLPAIELTDTIDFEFYKELFSLFFPEHAHKAKNNIILSFFRKYKYCSLENACLLMHYALLIGAKTDASVEELLDALVVPEKSLFVVSSYFFAKQDKEFFQLWSAIKDDYSDVFWTTFWSEQLFRAYCFVELMQKKDIVQAKKCAFRLPFSFIQKDWKRTTLGALKNAHAHITTIDWNIKNGVSPYFEHFFLNFF